MKSRRAPRGHSDFWPVVGVTQGAWAKSRDLPGVLRAWKGTLLPEKSFDRIQVLATRGALRRAPRRRSKRTRVRRGRRQAPRAEAACWSIRLGVTRQPARRAARGPKGPPFLRPTLRLRNPEDSSPFEALLGAPGLSRAVVQKIGVAARCSPRFHAPSSRPRNPGWVFPFLERFSLPRTRPAAESEARGRENGLLGRSLQPQQQSLALGQPPSGRPPATEAPKALARCPV